MILLTGLVSRLGHPDAVGPLVAASVYALGLAGAILIPGGDQVSAMLTANYQRAIRIFLVGLGLVAIGVALALLAEIFGIGQGILGG